MYLQYHWMWPPAEDLYTSLSTGSNNTEPKTKTLIWIALIHQLLLFCEQRKKGVFHVSVMEGTVAVLRLWSCCRGDWVMEQEMMLWSEASIGGVQGLRTNELQSVMGLARWVGCVLVRVQPCACSTSQKVIEKKASDAVPLRVCHDERWWRRRLWRTHRGLLWENQCSDWLTDCHLPPSLLMCNYLGGIAMFLLAINPNPTGQWQW